MTTSFKAFGRVLTLETADEPDGCGQFHVSVSVNTVSGGSAVLWSGYLTDKSES